VYSTAKRIAEPLAEATEARRGRAQLRHEGRATILGNGGAVLGRSKDCDVVVSDENVSRRHAEVRTTGSTWTVRDLGSTNGVKVNGRRIDGAQTLRDGDVIRLGLSEITFEES
jgi:pSer/pThr/pTyr-binding forkhead associated (FHA) protein